MVPDGENKGRPFVSRPNSPAAVCLLVESKGVVVTAQLDISHQLAIVPLHFCTAFLFILHSLVLFVVVSVSMVLHSTLQGSFSTFSLHSGHFSTLLLSVYFPPPVLILFSFLSISSSRCSLTLTLCLSGINKLSAGRQTKVQKRRERLLTLITEPSSFLLPYHSIIGLSLTLQQYLLPAFLHAIECRSSVCYLIPFIALTLYLSSIIFISTIVSMNFSYFLFHCNY